MKSIEIKVRSSAYLTIRISSMNNENYGRVYEDRLKPVFHNDVFRSEYVHEFSFKKEENKARFVSTKNLFKKKTTVTVQIYIYIYIRISYIYIYMYLFIFVYNSN